MRKKRLKRQIGLVFLTIVLFVMFLASLEPMKIQATSTGNISEEVLMQFSSSATSADFNNDGVFDDVAVGLRYVVYLKNNPDNKLDETVYIENGKAIQLTKTINLYLIKNGVTYIGPYTFTFSFDTSIPLLTLNGKQQSLGTVITSGVSVFPETHLDAAIIPVGMAPKPFSQVKAVVSSDPNYVVDFNSVINNSITDKLILESTKYGTDIQTQTTLKMYIWYWKRLPDGTYDKSQEKTQLQVIYSAADLLNPTAGQVIDDDVYKLIQNELNAQGNWTGNQLYRQLVNVASYNHSTMTVQTYLGTVYKTVYIVQNNIGTIENWGYNDVIGATSPITTGSCVETSTKHCSTKYYKYSRYKIVCGADTAIEGTQLFWVANKFSTAAAGDNYCFNLTDGTHPYYDGIQQTETTGWITNTSYSGYSLSSTGYKYQVWVVNIKWGPQYETETRPTTIELNDEMKQIIGTKSVPQYLYSTSESVQRIATTITSADLISESNVNQRTDAYNVGLVDTQVLAYSIDLASYLELASIYMPIYKPKAVAQFKEGNYWGLYLYQTGHWRATEISVPWFNVSGSYSDAVELVPGTIIDNPDYSAHIIEFTYVESIFNKVKAQNKGKSIGEIQDLFLLSVSQDKSWSAMKFCEYYNALIDGGSTKAAAFYTISKEFDINLIS